MKKLPRSKCLQCGNECKRATTKFCSQICQGAYRTIHKIRQGGPKLKILPRDCLTCGVSFLPKDYKKEQKFCSQHCMGLARADFCSALGKAQRGQIKSAEARENMSKAQSNRLAETSYTRGIGGVRADLGHYVRSSWEANIARILIYEGLTYEFEPDVIELSYDEGTIRYKPDFKVKGRYLEIKGWWTDRSLRIKELVEKTDIKIEYITEKEYRMLQDHYMSLIPNWEEDRRRRSADE